MGAITELPDPPTSTSPATFEAEADALFAALPTFVNELNDVVVAMNLNDVSDTSTTPHTINLTAGKAFTVSAGKGFLKGGYLIIADNAAPTTNSMVVQIVSYSGTTLTVDPVSKKGSGTKSSWVISFSAKPPDVGDHRIVVHTGNGNGSTNTKIRRFATTLTSTGTAISYNDSSTLGSDFTINEDGFYSIRYEDVGTTNSYIGLSLNSTELTTSIFSIAVADRLAEHPQSGSGLVNSVTICRKFLNGDVIRPHNGGSNTDTSNKVFFAIEKIGDV